MDVPLSGVGEGRDRHGLAAVEPDQRCIDQLADVHHARQRVDVDAAMLPDLGAGGGGKHRLDIDRSEEHTSELQSLMRISYAVFCLKKKKKRKHTEEERT